MTPLEELYEWLRLGHDPATWNEEWLPEMAKAVVFDNMSFAQKYVVLTANEPDFVAGLILEREDVQMRYEDLFYEKWDEWPQEQRDKALTMVKSRMRKSDHVYESMWEIVDDTLTEVKGS